MAEVADIAFHPTLSHDATTTIYPQAHSASHLNRPELAFGPT